MKKFLLTTTALLMIAPIGAYAETLKTRIGDLSITQDFANGYSTDETSKKLYEEMDFQRATQAYIWSTPLVSMAAWKHSLNDRFGSVAAVHNLTTPMTAFGLRLQPVDATHWLNRSAGVLKSSVFLGRSLSCRATAFNLF